MNKAVGFRLAGLSLLAAVAFTDTSCVCPCRTARLASGGVPVQPDRDTTFYQEVSWSPDGSRLLMSQLRHGVYRICESKADGAGFHFLTDGPGGDYWSAWSPDGLRIAFNSNRDGNAEICVMNADGTSLVRLTDNPADDAEPSWSPDGAQIAFNSKRDGDWRTYVMNADGSHQHRIGPDVAGGSNPAWSPDGRRIASYGGANGQDSLFVMNADGTGRAVLTDGFWPSWAAGGSGLVFSRRRAGIFTMDADGSNQRMLVPNAFFGEMSPDGKRLAFIRTMWKAANGWPSTSDVFVLDLATAREIRVTGR